MKVLITFGFQHKHKVGEVEFNRDTVGVIECANYAEGRELAMLVFCSEFHNAYVEGSEPKDFMSHFPLGRRPVN